MGKKIGVVKKFNKEIEQFNKDRSEKFNLIGRLIKGMSSEAFYKGVHFGIKNAESLRKDLAIARKKLPKAPKASTRRASANPEL